MKIHLIRFWTLGGWFTWIAVAIGGSALVGAGTAIYEGSQTQKAINSQKDLLAGLTYQPIDIKKLQADATAASIADATQSLALQRSLQPNVVRSNEALQKSVADELALGGQVNADTRNTVSEGGRVAGGLSGNTGNAAPTTAALLGLNAIDLLHQRQSAATQLAAANPAPTVGLSGSDIASAEVANNNALNQFALGKAGAQSNLINSQAQSNSATAAGVGSSLSQALALMALLGGSKTPSTVQPPATFNTPGSAYGIPSGSQLPVGVNGSTNGAVGLLGNGTGLTFGGP
jgi:hypothetical protein